MQKREKERCFWGRREFEIKEEWHGAFEVPGEMKSESVFKYSIYTDPDTAVIWGILFPLFFLMSARAVLSLFVEKVTVIVPCERTIF